MKYQHCAFILFYFFKGEIEDRKTIKKVDDMKKDFLSKLQRQNASILSSSFDDDLVPDISVLDPEFLTDDT